MTNRIYLSDAFGWDTEWRSKAAISQLREESVISDEACPKAQLIKNSSFRGLVNPIKIIGYVPVLNFVAGAVTIYYAENGRGLRPSNRQMWIGRGVLMMLTGPLLAVADSVKFIFDYTVVAQYDRENRERMNGFNVSHEHSSPYWPGHPIKCLQA